MHTRILIVEDEAAIRDMVAFALRKADMQVIQAADARAAEAAIAEQRPDLILMDWMLPGTSGLELTRQLRRAPATADLPIIMLTARGEEMDRVKGLELGVDDYVAKPFSVRELVARIKAVLRRTRADAGTGVIAAGPLRMDEAAHRVYAGDVELDLSPAEYRLLHFLMSHPERAYTRAQLLDHVWGAGVYVQERSVDVQVRRLRRLLEPHGLAQRIQTVRGTGYRFAAAP